MQYPERPLKVLREFAIAAGLGRKRPRPRKEARPKMGSEGEDVVADDAGGLKLACPARFQPGTMKAAAWQVRRWQRARPHALSLRQWVTQRLRIECMPFTVPCCRGDQCDEPALTQLYQRICASASHTRYPSSLR